MEIGLCTFFDCKWLWHMNVGPHGLYQCSRCKTISIGASREPTNDELKRHIAACHGIDPERLLRKVGSALAEAEKERR